MRRNMRESERDISRGESYRDIEREVDRERYCEGFKREWLI